MNLQEYEYMLSKYTAFGGIATAISMAKDVGILDILLNADEPITSHEIADQGKFKERYVRELVNALVTAKVVQTDKSSSHFYIEESFQTALKQNAIGAGYVPYLGEKYKSILNCFPKSGTKGVRYDEYPAFFNMLDERRKLIDDAFLDQELLPATAGIVGKLDAGIDVAEVGCAKGSLLLNLAKRFPRSSFTGNDVVKMILDIACQRASKDGLANCRFEILDICHVPEKPKKLYDWIYSRHVIHDLPDPVNALLGIKRMLKPGGVFTMLELGTEGALSDNIENIDTSFLYVISVFDCIPESFQNEMSAAYGPCWNTETIRDVVRKAGFKLVHTSSCRNKNEYVFVCVTRD